MDEERPSETAEGSSASSKNLVRRRSFSEMLEASIRKYKARAIERAKVIEELIALAKELREAERRHRAAGRFSFKADSESRKNRC
jgi:type I restriction enzyme R subunit